MVDDDLEGAIASRDGLTVNTLALVLSNLAKKVSDCWLTMAGECEWSSDGRGLRLAAPRCSAVTAIYVGSFATPSGVWHWRLILRLWICPDPLFAADKTTFALLFHWKEIKERKNTLIQTFIQTSERECRCRCCFFSLAFVCCHNYKRIVIKKITRTENYAVRE